MSEQNVGQTPTTRTSPTSPTTPTTPTGGRRVVADRYAVTGELGRGGMGVVWKAQDTVIGRDVAIKELRLADGAENVEVFQERVLREVRTGGKVNDPAVVTVFDVIAEGDATYIVMELVEAPTLSEVVRGQGPLPPHQVASIGGQVLTALQAAHRAGIVHRDVKPANIMVAANGRVKLTDFGIAQAVDDPRLTTSGMLVGSPAFMAPERVAGHDAQPASDLWSLGASLFFAVEGVLPFERSSTAATLHAIMHEVPYLTHAQGPLASAIMGMLISTPDARIDGGQAQHLLTIAAQQPPGAPSTPPDGQTRVYGAQPTMVGGHVGVGGTGGAPVTSGANGTNGTSRRGLLTAAGVVLGVALLVGGFFLGTTLTEPAVDESMLPTLTYGAGGQVPDLAIESTTYSCLNTPLQQGASIGDTNWVDCDEQGHAAEYVASATPLPTEDSSSYTDEQPTVARYPGIEQLTAYAETWCGNTFHSDAVPDSLLASLRYRAVVPTEGEWNARPAEDGSRTRQVHCFLLPADGGSLAKGTVTRPIA